MKVLKIIHTQGHGGAENAFRWLAMGLRQEGINVTAAIPKMADTQKCWLATALDNVGVPYIYFDKRGSPAKLLSNIYAVVKQVRPDIVHSHLLDSNFYASLVCRGAGVPHISTEHGDLLFVRSMSANIKCAAISLCSRRVVCVSEAVRNKAKDLIAARKLIIIPNGINFFKSGPSSFRDELGIPSTAFVIGNVGNLYPVKGQKLLIEAFAALLKSYPDARLVLVGRGGEEKNLKQLVQDLGIAQGRILFTGFREDVENIVNSLDLYVQPSFSEGHPLAVLEAMSVGVPVISFAVGGLPELFENGKYGTLVKCVSSTELHDRLLQCATDPNPYIVKALLAQRYVKEHFSIERMAHRHIALYQQAMATS